jgi:hypothetical protein
MMASFKRTGLIALSFLAIPLVIVLYSLNLNGFCYRDLTFRQNNDFVRLALEVEFARKPEFRGIVGTSLEDFAKMHVNCCTAATAKDSLSFVSILFGLVRTDSFLSYRFTDDTGGHKLEVWYTFDCCGNVLSRNQMKD